MSQPAHDKEGKANGDAHEAELVISAQAGSKDAFEELQKLHWFRLHRTVLAITKNREDAEDALQDTFLRAYLALGTFEGRSKFGSWLTRIAVNSALMLVRKRRAHPELLIDQSSEPDDATSFDIRDSGLNPEQIYDQHQRCLGMFRAMQGLDPKLQTAMRIRTLQEWSINEIAETLGISYSAAKTRLHRARQRLRRSLDLANSRRHISLLPQRADPSLHADSGLSIDVLDERSQLSRLL
jgi:RNA polymerase sigma-70 factor, ECF subfamily